MGEDHRIKLLEKSLGPIGMEDIDLRYGTSLSGEEVWVDGWTFPFLDRKEEVEDSWIPPDFLHFYAPPPTNALTVDDLRFKLFSFILL
jgi:hypothetical protein